MSVDLTLL